MFAAVGAGLLIGGIGLAAMFLLPAGSPGVSAGGAASASAPPIVSAPPPRRRPRPRSRGRAGAERERARRTLRRARRRCERARCAAEGPDAEARAARAVREEDDLRARLSAAAPIGIGTDVLATRERCYPRVRDHGSLLCFAGTGLAAA